MILLFSYGSNHIEQLEERLGHAVRKVSAAYASDWKRVFRGYSQNWGGGVATLIKQKGAVTYGFTAEVSEQDMRTLDQYEGSRYQRTPITCRDDNDHARKCIAYIRPGGAREAFSKPSRAYLEACAKTVGLFWQGENGKVTWRDFDVS